MKQLTSNRVIVMPLGRTAPREGGSSSPSSKVIQMRPNFAKLATPPSYPNGPYAA